MEWISVCKRETACANDLPRCEVSVWAWKREVESLRSSNYRERRGAPTGSPGRSTQWRTHAAERHARRRVLQTQLNPSKYTACSRSREIPGCLPGKRSRTPDLT